MNGSSVTVFRRITFYAAEVVLATIFMMALFAAPAWADATLTVTKSDSPESVSVGNDLTYTITVTNTGPDSATGVVLTDPLPANTTFVSVNSPGNTCTSLAVGASSGPITCDLGTVAVATPETVTITVRPTAAAGEAGFVDNTATAKGSNTNTASVTERTTVLPSGITIEKDDFPDPADVGESLLYRLTVTNNGLLPRDVDIVDALPDGVDFISVSTTAGSCTESSNVVRCRIDALAAGTPATIRIFTQPLEEGKITNTARVFLQSDRFTPIAQGAETTLVEDGTTTGGTTGDTGGTTGDTGGTTGDTGGTTGDTGGTTGDTGGTTGDTGGTTGDTGGTTGDTGGTTGDTGGTTGDTGGPNEEKPVTEPQGEVVNEIATEDLPNTGGVILATRGAGLAIILFGGAGLALLLVKVRRERT